MAECMITTCMNHSLSDAGCTASSADTNDKTTVISTDVSVTSDNIIIATRDQENKQCTCKEGNIYIDH